MAIETRERRIGDHTYRVTQFGAKQGRAMLVRLVKLGGPGVGSFVGGVGRGDAMESALALGVGDALHDLAGRLNEAEIASMMDEFAKFTVLVQSADVELRLSDILDDHFAGAYDEMLQWVRFALEVNFASFFVGTKGGGAFQRLWKMAQAWSSQRTSTGTSTGSQPANATPQA
jgi:hypothetical protein